MTKGQTHTIGAEREYNGWNFYVLIKISSLGLLFLAQPIINTLINFSNNPKL